MPIQRTPRSNQPPGRAQNMLRQVRVGARRTSIRMEWVFWEALQLVADEHGVDQNDLIERIGGLVDAADMDIGLTSAVRVFVMSNIMRRLLKLIPKPPALPPEEA